MELYPITMNYLLLIKHDKHSRCAQLICSLQDSLAQDLRGMVPSCQIDTNSQMNLLLCFSLCRSILAVAATSRA